MTIYRMDSEEEALFRSYPYAVYYVQSPSTVSHANSAEFRNINNESVSETFVLNNPTSKESANRLALSHYSSSRGSTNSFLHEKKIPCDDAPSHGTGVTAYNEETNDDNDDHHQSNNIVNVVDHQVRNGYKEGHHEYYEEDEEYPYFEGDDDVWWRMFSYSHSSSVGWKLLQITWRFVLSMVVALLVFYIITKPPAPNMSIKMSRVAQFELTEGVDTTGVTTKMLTTNCSINLKIENKSKLFGLHVRVPFLAMSFGNLPFAVAQGPEVQVGIDNVQHLMLLVGTRNKPMYGAGRSMQDLLESNKGLPLAIHTKLRSSFHVLLGLINPKFHHQAECLIVVGRAYDKKHKTQEYIGRCTISS